MDSEFNDDSILDPVLIAKRRLYKAGASVIVFLLMYSFLSIVNTYIIPKYTLPGGTVFLTDLWDLPGVPPRFESIQLNFESQEDLDSISDFKKTKYLHFLVEENPPFNPYVTIPKYYNSNTFVWTWCSLPEKNRDDNSEIKKMIVAYNCNNEASILCEQREIRKYCRHVNMLKSPWLNSLSLRKKDYRDFIRFHLFNIYGNSVNYRENIDIEIKSRHESKPIFTSVTVRAGSGSYQFNSVDDNTLMALRNSMKSNNSRMDKTGFSHRCLILYKVYSDIYCSRLPKVYVSEILITLDSKGILEIRENRILNNEYNSSTDCR